MKSSFNFENWDLEKKVKRLSELFDKLVLIMERENEKNWIKSVENIRDRLKTYQEYNAHDLKEIVLSGKLDYYSITAGMGSFSDFHIWRDSFEERRELNNLLSQVLDEIWFLFESVSGRYKTN